MFSDNENKIDDDVVIRVSHVSKCFEIYDRPRHRLQQMIFGKFHKWYREFWALNDVSFEIRRGECVGLIGHNGSGKSTMLQIITGTLQPTSGEVIINNKDKKLRIAALLELGSGFNPEFTGRENVYLNASILGMEDEETDEKFAEIEAFADIGDFIDQPVKSYSSGMMVRLAFAVQVMVKPDILIVDEALAVGDAAFQKKCLEAIDKLLKEKHTTVLFVSHSKEVVRAICNRSILLQHGKKIYDGTVDSAFQKYILGGEISLSPCHIDLSNYERNETNQPLKIKIMSFEVLDKEQSVFKEREKIRLKITCKGLADCSGVRFRIHFSAVETELNVASASSLPEISIKENEIKDFIYTLDLGYLAPSVYCMTFALSEYLLNGQRVFNYDYILKFFRFKICDDETLSDNLRWQPSWWGYVRMPKMELQASEPEQKGK